MKHFKPIIALWFVGLILIAGQTNAQNDVMMQAFYWDVPVDDANKNGTWWDNLSSKSTEMKNAGITGIWIPSPSKGNWGIFDMGYGIYDHYDLGNYYQKNTTETRFGSRAELENMISVMHNTAGGQPRINVYADVVLNHVYSSDENEEVNPAVKGYVFDEAYRNGQQYTPYPTNEIKWVIPNAGSGDYYIKIKGYYLPWSSGYKECGYDVEIDYAGTGFNGNYSWESEPNNGGGQFDVFPASGNLVRGFIDNSNDIDEYKVTVSGTQDIIIKLTARRQDDSGIWNWTGQTNGFYPFQVWHSGQNLANTTLEARTNTYLSYPNHTGTGEANYTWNYSHFHPVDGNDWLGDWGTDDEIITNTKGFGNDFNTFSTVVQSRLEDWGYWLADEIDFDGFRLDFVRGFQEELVADWVNNLPLLDGNQRFIVGEYWGKDYRIKNWVNNVGSYGADVDAFDFPLKFTLTEMCNGDANWNMSWLNNAGMVRNNQNNGLPGTSVVTFLDNHDTGKEHDKWVTKDWKMGYAYMLTHEGRPCLFYSHYYGVTMVDNHDNSITVTPDASLKSDINRLMFVRRTYLGGSLQVLTEVGNPYPSGNVSDVYVARREGNGTKDGAIVVINNSYTTKGVWIDATPAGWNSWSGETLVNAFNSGQTSQVYDDGRVYVEAPARGYAIYVKQSDYVAYTTPSARTINPNIEETQLIDDIQPEFFTFDVQNFYPNPAAGTASMRFTVPEKGQVNISITDMTGRISKTFVDGTVEKGEHLLELDLSGVNPGVYLYQIQYENDLITNSFVVAR
jgi:alpha-amylase